MLGAIIGDIIGSSYEFNSTNDYNFELFKKGSDFTDDTICTIAVADAIMHGKDYGKSLHEWCRKYPSPKGGYGGRFRQWVMNDNPKPYYSLGNGSAMRVSPIAWACLNLTGAMHEAEKSSSCTHNHPEGIKGAVATVMAIHFGDELRRLSTQISKESILKAFQPIIDYTHYNINIRKEDVVNRFDETCPGTVPVALWIISESTGFEDAIRKAISLGADADTLGAIVGGIAEAIWGIPEDIAQKAMDYLPDEMKTIVHKFYSLYNNRNLEQTNILGVSPTDGKNDDGEEDSEITQEQMKSIMLWKLGLGHMGKYLAGEDPMPSKEKRTTFDSWDVKAMPKDNISEIPIYYELSEEKMRIIKQGHLPESQEDHWFMCCERNYIRYFRSWSGMCAFVAHFRKSQDRYIIDSLMMNHALTEFGVNGDEPAKALFFYLLSSETDGFNEGLWQAYLDAWEKQVQVNAELAQERERNKKENYRRNLSSTVEQNREAKKERRKKLTKGAVLFKTTNIAYTKLIENQRIFYMFEENDFLTMKLEPENKHDENAVALYFGEDKVGYVPERDNKEIAQLLRSGWDKLFLVYVSHWNGCGDKRWISIKILIRECKNQNSFDFCEEAYKTMEESEQNQLYFSTGGTTGILKGRTTPSRIDHLGKDEIFVFGSNKSGQHLGGAASAAMKKFGAIWGQGDGLQGQSYAISTMEGLLETAKNVNRFLKFASEHQDLKFLVTPIGCGIAGYNPLEIAPLFNKAVTLPNVFLPRIFWEYYWQINGIYPDFFSPSNDWKKWDKKS